MGLNVRSRKKSTKKWRKINVHLHSTAHRNFRRSNKGKVHVDGAVLSFRRRSCRNTITNLKVSFPSISWCFGLLQVVFLPQAVGLVDATLTMATSAGDIHYKVQVGVVVELCWPCCSVVGCSYAQRMFGLPCAMLFHAVVDRLRD